MTFPATGDTFTVASYPFWWHNGDQVVGTLTPGMARVNGLPYDLTINNNALDPGAHVDLDLTVNGVVVGSFTVLPGQTSRSVSFAFAFINGPSYTVRLRETNTVASGLGSIQILLDTSRITLVGRVFLPAVVKH